MFGIGLMTEDQTLTFFFCFLVDTLFQVFCECAELNPEPVEGGSCLHFCNCFKQMISISISILLFNACYYSPINRY